MFEMQDAQVGWHGQFQNKKLGGAVFVYLVKAKVLASGRELEVLRKGDVMLMR